MNDKRRSFLKKALVGSAAGVATTILASDLEKQQTKNGVIQGKAHKKEIIYHTSDTWKQYYKQSY
ncbi:twin-arginine translocation signal domain-containing protein [Campylobacter corcagiensis]|uniref:Twin-arginine translocation signal domain-containing protein n=1 Tax=Campylobacter corcagiensis TaxID=1448857 RepID=A0A7M1LKJ9_9BACT|nr:twin-arginine translocation signal domain-containing protein [Campylobacter corcagiensis]QKF65368.1 putative formate dehydrogenase-associated protein [Campylobacter corcagiensis]QOQ88055.1 twin-arginine translocation signal domain-containing protein [Campylobacter corcagiensis]